MADKEIVEFDGIQYSRYPNSTNKTDARYFKTIVDGKPKYLHRAIWEYYNGAIPEGYQIHHKDESFDNNEIYNFDCVTPKRHGEYHAEKYREERKKTMDYARIFASEWHRSEEGREWHRQAGELSWVDAKPIQLVCKNCEKEFETLARHGNTEFCSNACKSAYRRKSGIDNEIRQCQFCEQGFTTNKYSKVRYCTRHHTRKSRGL